MTESNVRPFRKPAKAKKERDEARGRRDEPPPPDEGGEDLPCPVTALGFEGKWLFFATPQGDARAIDSERMGPVALDGLFMGDVQWAVRRYRKYDAKGKPVDDAYDAEQVRRHLQRDAAVAGPIDVETKIRGPGLYRSGKELVLHLGDALWVFGPDRRVFSEEAVGLRDADGKLYPVRVPAPRPAHDGKRLAPASAARCKELLTFLSNWVWRAPRLAERFWLGWNFSAMACGALRWRAHLIVTGDFGEGKSLLRALAVGLQGGEDAVLKLAASSAPAVRNLLRVSAAPVFLNEVENAADPARTDAIIDLANVASTDGEGDVARADLRGGALRWPVRSSIYLEAINPPAMKPQDKSRFTMLELARLHTSAERAAQVRDGVEALIAEAPAFRARALAGFDRFLVNFAVYAEALADVGATTRQADQLGTILAWADVALSDAPTGTADARALVEQLEPAELVPPRDELSDAAQCWQHLCGAIDTIEMLTGGRRRLTLGEVMAEHAKTGAHSHGDLLRTIGIVLRKSRDGEDWIVVANSAAGLARIFDGTRWRGGAWQTSLRRLDGARAGDPVRMGGPLVRGTWIPLARLTEGDDEEAQPREPPPDRGLGNSTA